MDPVQLLGMVLDLIDAVVGAVAIVSCWYTWGMAKKRDPPRPTNSHLSGRAQIDRFLHKARTCNGSRRPCREETR
jgi:hypothetical protein